MCSLVLRGLSTLNTIKPIARSAELRNCVGESRGGLPGLLPVPNKHDGFCGCIPQSNTLTKEKKRKKKEKKARVKKDADVDSEAFLVI